MADDDGTFGRYRELALDDMTADQRAAYDDCVKVRGQVPGPYRIFVQNPALMAVMVPYGAYFANGGSSLSQVEREIATSVVNGTWVAAYSNYEHEMIGEKAGIDPLRMQALIDGQPTSFDDQRQQVVYEVSLALMAARRVPRGLFDRAVHLLGDDGVTDLTTLLGYFTTISMTLNTYDVPAGAEGLQR